MKLLCWLVSQLCEVSESDPDSSFQAHEEINSGLDEKDWKKQEMPQEYSFLQQCLQGGTIKVPF